MGIKQSNFLTSFQEAFLAKTGHDFQWTGGQLFCNTAGLPLDTNVRRAGNAKAGERFELGDLTANVGGWKVVIEFESGYVTPSNLLKYWPCIRGELDIKPTQPLLICHFSDWWSYATRRDLWEWTLHQMKEDTKKLVQIEGRQFDHWGRESDNIRRDECLKHAIEWIRAIVRL